MAGKSVPASTLQSVEIFGLMSLGLFFDMTHAMDADHTAAVSAMWNRRGGKHGLMRRGLYWGADHGIALSALAGTRGTIFGNLFSAITSCLCL